MSDDYCPICTKLVSDKCNSIQCDICDLWVHQSKCSGLTPKQFEVLSQPNSANWYCPNCINTTLPFPTAESVSTGVSPGSKMSDNLKSLLSDLNKVVSGLMTNDDDEDELEIQFHANSCSYLDCVEFNSIISKTPTKFSAFHLNIASMSKHFDELGDLLAQLKCDFSFIGISETRRKFG